MLNIQGSDSGEDNDNACNPEPEHGTTGDCSKKGRNRASSKGFGNYGFDDYPSSPVIDIEVDSHRAGDRCPCCHSGKLYPGDDRLLLEFKGNPPITVTRYRKKSLRCNACGYIAIKGQKINKWDNSARSAVVIQKTLGMPFNRLEKLQNMHGVPVAQSTLWQLCLDMWNDVGRYTYEALLKELSDKSYTYYVDDSGARILEVMAANKELPEKQRRACHTTNICAQTVEGNNIVLYLTANQYCGENLAPILSGRANKDRYIRIMSDASTQNNLNLEEKELSRIINANCMAHGHNKLKEHKDYYPEECNYLLSEIAAIYKIDERYKNTSANKRFKEHKKQSRIHINRIYKKIHELFANRAVEPNSEFGKVLNYWLRHKRGLTMFLRVKGIELDNNRAERALKAMIAQRKNSLFFKTKNSAMILSGLTSLAKTCEANGINAYEYFNWLQDNRQLIEKGSIKSLPWDYTEYTRKDTELIAA